MNRLVDFIGKVVYVYEIEIAEAQSIWEKALIGIAIIMNYPPKNDAAFDSLKSFSNLPAIAVALSLVALVHTYGLVINKVAYRKLSSFLACILWSYITAVVVGTHDMVALLSFTFALSSALVYLRLTGLLSGKRRTGGKDEGMATIPGSNGQRFDSTTTR